MLPSELPELKGGRPWIDNRAVLTGILFVLKAGIPWEMLPREMGSTLICWNAVQRQSCQARMILSLRFLLMLVYTGTPVNNAKKSRDFGATGRLN